jgi:hypothetical protein
VGPGSWTISRLFKRTRAACKRGFSSSLFEYFLNHVQGFPDQVEQFFTLGREELLLPLVKFSNEVRIFALPFPDGLPGNPELFRYLSYAFPKSKKVMAFFLAEESGCPQKSNTLKSFHTL